MTKKDIKPNDILIFKNGSRVTIDIETEWVLHEFYDDNLNCIRNDDFSIIKVLRPQYEEIYNRDEYKSAVELKEEILRLYARNKER